MACSASNFSSAGAVEKALSLDQSRHGSTLREAGGSNYTFVDGSARYLKWGAALAPVNLFLVLPSYRNLGATGSPP